MRFLLALRASQPWDARLRVTTDEYPLRRQAPLHVYTPTHFANLRALAPRHSTSGSPAKKHAPMGKDQVLPPHSHSDFDRLFFPKIKLCIQFFYAVMKGQNQLNSP